MTAKLYGVFALINGKAVWAMARNKRVALRTARKYQGYVTWMPLPSPEARVWDAPTFLVSSDLLADFRADTTDEPGGEF